MVIQNLKNHGRQWRILAPGNKMQKKILDLIKKKNKSKIVCLTAYSMNVASIIDKNCDIVLVWRFSWFGALQLFIHKESNIGYDD